MLKRPKSIAGILWFILAAIRITSHVRDYKSGKNPTGIKLMNATLDIVLGMMMLMSDAFDRKHEAMHSDVVESDGEEITDDLGDLSDGDCEACRG